MSETRPRILILEDDDSFRTQLASVLQRKGYQVQAVGRAAEAVELARSTAFDLVVADIRMPGVSGLDALDQVKQHQPEVSSIVVTGYSTEADSIRAVRLGVGDYLKKPFPLQTFLESVQRLLAQGQQQRAERERRSGVRRTALWAMEMFAGSLELAGQGVALLDPARRVVQLCDELGVPDERSEELRLASLIRQTASAGTECPEFLLSALPAAVQQLIQTPSGLEEQILRAACEGVSEDPRVREALRKVESGAARGRRERPRNETRSLVSLARALVQAGQTDEAERAYRHVLELESEPSRETLETCLGLAHLARGRVQSNELRQYATRAVEIARHLGPTTTGWACLRASQLTEDTAWCDEALRTFQEVQLESGIAMAQLAGTQGRLDPASLEVLLQEENASLLVDAADWMLPRLLAEEPGPAVERALRLLSHNAPGELLRLVLSGRLKPRGRQEAARWLGLCDHPGARPALEQLAADPDTEVRQAARAALEPGQAQVQMLPLLRLFSLGAFEAYRGEDRIPDSAFKSQKVRYLLACLGLSDRPVSEDLLLETFWPDDLDRGKNNLYTATFYLRGALRGKGVKDGPDFVLRSPAGLQLNPDIPCWHDVKELERALDRGDQLRSSGQLDAALDHYRRASQLYRGAYLEGCYLEWALLRRGQLELRVSEALLCLASGRHQQGRWQECLEVAQRLVQIDPCSQGAYRMMMAAYLSLNRAADAVRCYQSARATLERELGMEPDPELKELLGRAESALEPGPRR